MDKIPCCHCGDVFERSVRHKNQLYCMRSECCRAKKARWQRQKMATDPEYRANQKTSHQKWLQANPSYWRQHRQRNPEKTKRNRILQAIRNRRRTGVHAKMDSSLIAKMDASIINAFKFFSGCPKQVLVDNMLTAVTERCGAVIRFNESFLDFLRIFKITPQACNIRAPYEKGKVESSVKYLRHNFWPLRSFENLADAQRQVVDWLNTVANVRIHLKKMWSACFTLRINTEPSQFFGPLKKPWPMAPSAPITSKTSFTRK